MRIFCISGKAQHGKDTVAQMISNELTNQGKKALILHNADLLKFMCKQLFGWNGKKDEHGRWLLQYVGTDVIRKKEPTFWVDFIKKIVELFPDEWDYVIIPDCRFPNEIEWLKKTPHEVRHLRVVRPRFASPLTPEQQRHPSETALDNTPPDDYVLNNGTLDDLKCAVQALLADCEHSTVFNDIRTGLYEAIGGYQRDASNCKCNWKREMECRYFGTTRQ